MKIRRILCYILIFLFCTLANAQNKEPSGIELCGQVHNFLKKNGFSPVSQSLVVSGENAFPYNIIVTFPSEQKASPENLLLVFFQEDVPLHQDAIKEALKRVREAKLPFNVTALFAYGEKQKLEKADMIYGTSIYLESLNTNLSYTAAIFEFGARENEIETTSNGLSSPPQLIQNAMNLYTDYEIDENLPPFILSQLSSFNFISSRILGGFFEYDIPAIKLSLKDIEEKNKGETAANIITGFIQSFSKTIDDNWDHHFLIFKLFGSYHIISEIIILRIVTPTIFLWILFIFILIFVNRRMKKHTWSTIGKIWWSVPLTYLLLTACFILSAFFSRNLFTNSSDAAKIYGQLILQISLSLFVILSVYLLILALNYTFSERAVDYLIVISCFINQSLFILADISLSPIFIAICLLSLLALTVKNNYLHVAVFLMMIAPLIPYGHRMISAADLHLLALFLKESRNCNFVIPLVLYPVFIVLFRIITSVRTHRKKMRFVVISTAAAFMLVSLALICMGLVRTKSLNKKQIELPEISLKPLGNELISLTVSDQTIFDDTIRSIDISLAQPCLLCDVLIVTEDTTPILYSDYDYTSPAGNSARFRIPNNPPEQMSFKYGAAEGPSRITVSAVIEGQNDGDYQFISKSLEIGDK